MPPVLPTGCGGVLIVARYEDRPRKFPLPVCGETVVRWATRGFGQIGPVRRSQVCKARRSGVAGCTGYVAVPGLTQCGWPDDGAPAFGNRRPLGLPEPGHPKTSRARYRTGLPKSAFYPGAEVASGLRHGCETLLRIGPYAPTQEAGLGMHAYTKPACDGEGRVRSGIGHRYAHQPPHTRNPMSRESRPRSLQPEARPGRREARGERREPATRRPRQSRQARGGRREPATQAARQSRRSRQSRPSKQSTRPPRGGTFFRTRGPG
jgi:hypothetical protein